MKKRLLVVGMVFAMAFTALTACSSGAKNETTAAPTEAATEAAAETTEAAKEESVELFNGDAVIEENGSVTTLENAEEGWEASRDEAYKNATADGKKAPGDRYVRSKEEDVIRLVNAQRAAAGLGALTLDETMMAGAEARASEQKASFSHTRPDGRDCFSVFADFNIPANYRGENVGMGNICTPEQIMNCWMNSEGHRANIMNGGFTRIGVGYFESGNYGYWAQIFAN